MILGEAPAQRPKNLGLQEIDCWVSPHCTLVVGTGDGKNAAKIDGIFLFLRLVACFLTLSNILGKNIGYWMKNPGLICMN